SRRALAVAVPAGAEHRQRVDRDRAALRRHRRRARRLRRADAAAARHRAGARLALCAVRPVRRGARSVQRRLGGRVGAHRCDRAQARPAAEGLRVAGGGVHRGLRRDRAAALAVALAAGRAVSRVDRDRVVPSAQGNPSVIPPALLELTAQFLLLSMLSIGGANAIIPEIHRRVVDLEHWMTDADFAQLFALSQAAPGPNVLIVSLVGWKVAGVIGGVVAMLAMSGPSSILTYWVA